MSGEKVVKCACDTGCNAKLYIEANEDGMVTLTIGQDEHRDTRRRSIVVYPSQLIYALVSLQG